MTKIVALVALAAACALPVPARAAAPSLAGHWEGAATKDGKTFRLRLDAGSRGGRPVAYVDYVDYLLPAIPFEVSVEGAKVRLERRPANGPVSTVTHSAEPNSGISGRSQRGSSIATHISP